MKSYIISNYHQKLHKNENIFNKWNRIDIIERKFHIQIKVILKCLLMVKAKYGSIPEYRV